MRKLTTAVLAVILFVAALWPRSTEAAPTGNVWFGCTLHLNYATMRYVVARECHTYAMPREHRHRIGWRITRTRRSPHVITSVRWPTFYVPPPPEPPVSSWPTVQRWSQYIYEAANRTGIPARVIAAVITVESAGDPYAVSYPSYGRADVGLMQVSYDAAVTVNGWYTYDPAANILTGSLYIDWLLRNCAGGNLYHAIAAFNGGCGGPNYAYAARVYQYV